MSGKFRIKRITNLNDITETTEFPESDYATLTGDNRFIQLEYVENVRNESEKYEVSPGIYTIVKTMSGLQLEKTSFTNDSLLEDFVNTKEIETRVDSFIRNIHKYKELGIDVAKRNVLLYGPPGTGKSSSISKVVQKYNSRGNCAVVIFPTEKLEAFQVKDFIKSFDYKGVELLILIMEDIGGVEIENRPMGADSGILSLLDNSEKTFNIATLILATTNYPENLMGSLTNRPGRFDDKIKADAPSAEHRIKLMSFFLKRELDSEETSLLSSKDANGFTPAHLKEVMVRAVIHEKTVPAVIKEVMGEIKLFSKGFNDKRRDAFGLAD